MEQRQECDWNRTYTQLLHNSSITQASIGVGQGVLAGGLIVAGLATGLVAVHQLACALLKIKATRDVLNADNVEALVGLGVDEILAADLDVVDGDGGAREERRQKVLGKHGVVKRRRLR